MTRHLVSIMDKKRDTRIPVYIFDIDGTLADHSGRLPHIANARDLPKDQRDAAWARFHEECHLDPPIEATCKLARTLHFAHAPIIFLTGRMDEQRSKTTRWLVEHTGIPYWGGPMGPYQGFDHFEGAMTPWQPNGGFPWLLMRPNGDRREDTIVKGEWLTRVEAYIASRMPEFVVSMAFEDRPRICELWEKRGLTVAKIGNFTEDQQHPASEAWPAPAAIEDEDDIADRIGMVPRGGGRQ